jgi:hypothetical protein
MAALQGITWSQDKINNMKKTLPDEIQLNRILYDIHTYIDTQQGGGALRAPNPAKFIGGNFNNVDNTARSAIYNSKYIPFSSPPMLTAV